VEAVCVVRIQHLGVSLSGLHQVVEDAKQKALQALKNKFYHTPDVSEIATAIVSHDHTK